MQEELKDLGMRLDELVEEIEEAQSEGEYQAANDLQDELDEVQEDYDQLCDQMKEELNS